MLKPLRWILDTFLTSLNVSVGVREDGSRITCVASTVKPPSGHITMRLCMVLLFWIAIVYLIVTAIASGLPNPFKSPGPMDSWTSRP